jgi:hypothetical protein
MLAFWPEILYPALSELQPDAIVEIGAESGKTTRLLIECARMYGGSVTSIDPAPRFDAESWQREYGPSFKMLRGRSLEMIPLLDRCAAVLVDGDHNWYTVYNELLAIEQRTSILGLPMPVVFLHDIGWPYGRRDLYYDPESIPAAYRHPYARKGIHPASSSLVDEGGINAHLHNAEHEGGPRNGVLSATEDFLEKTSQALDFVRIPAAFGLGILIPAHLEIQSKSAWDALHVWANPKLERFIARLEIARIGAALPPLSTVPRVQSTDDL